MDNTNNMTRLIRKVLFFLDYYVLNQGRILNYLRSKGTRIGYDCDILNSIENYGSEPWLIEIGNNVTVTRGVYFLTHDASSRLFRRNLENSSPFGNRFGPIRVHDNCFIGINSIILPGVTIGTNSIIGAGSVVVHDVPPNSVAAGAPAQVVSSLSDHIKKYKKKMIPITSENRQDLRKELTILFWGDER